MSPCTPKIRIRTRIYALTTSIQHYARYSGKGKEQHPLPTKKKKKIQIRKEEVGNFLAIQW